MEAKQIEILILVSRGQKKILSHGKLRICAGCGVSVPAAENLCPACTKQLHDGRVAWIDKKEKNNEPLDKR